MTRAVSSQLANPCLGVHHLLAQDAPTHQVVFADILATEFQGAFVHDILHGDGALGAHTRTRAYLIEYLYGIHARGVLGHIATYTTDTGLGKHQQYVGITQHGEVHAVVGTRMRTACGHPLVTELAQVEVVDLAVLEIQAVGVRIDAGESSSAHVGVGRFRTCVVVLPLAGHIGHIAALVAFLEAEHQHRRYADMSVGRTAAVAGQNAFASRLCVRGKLGCVVVHHLTAGSVGEGHHPDMLHLVVGNHIGADLLERTGEVVSQFVVLGGNNLGTSLQCLLIDLGTLSGILDIVGDGISIRIRYVKSVRTGTNSLAGIHQVSAGQQRQRRSLAGTTYVVLRIDGGDLRRPRHQRSSALQVQTNLLIHLVSVSLAGIHAIGVFGQGNKTCRHVAPVLDLLQISKRAEEQRLAQEICLRGVLIHIAISLQAFDDIVGALNHRVEVRPQVGSAGREHARVGGSAVVNHQIRLVARTVTLGTPFDIGVQSHISAGHTVTVTVVAAQQAVHAINSLLRTRGRGEHG